MGRDFGVLCFLDNKRSAWELVPSNKHGIKTILSLTSLQIGIKLELAACKSSDVRIYYLYANSNEME